MLRENMTAAEEALTRALFEYENNGTRYEPADREALMDLILKVEQLGKRLSVYMSELPFLDSHPIGVPILVVILSQIGVFPGNAGAQVAFGAGDGDVHLRCRIRDAPLCRCEIQEAIARPQ